MRYYLGFATNNRRIAVVSRVPSPPAFNSSRRLTDTELNQHDPDCKTKRGDNRILKEWTLRLCTFGLAEQGIISMGLDGVLPAAWTTLPTSVCHLTSHLLNPSSKA
jgi:hypothetical protein